jgi:hypothetical protein
MPDLRDLLHDAAPVAARDVDIDAVRARVRQRTRRRRALVGGAAAVVLLGIGVAAAALAPRDDDPHRRIDVIDVPTTVPASVPVPTTIAPAVWTTEIALRAPDGFVADAVLVDGDAVWVGGTQDGDGIVLQLDRSGEVLESYPLRMRLRGLALGEDTVWAWGGNDDGGVSIISRTSEHFVGHLFEPEVLRTPLDLAVDGDSAWVTDPTLGRLVQVRAQSPSGLGAGWSDVGAGPAEVVVLDDGSVWVRDEQAPGTIARVDPTTGEVVERQPWSGPLLAADGNQVWTTDGDRLVALTPSLLTEGVSVAVGERIDGLGTDIIGVVVDDGGIWVQQPNELCRFEHSSTGGFTLVTGLSATVSDIAADGDGLLHVDGRTNAIRRWGPPA